MTSWTVYIFSCFCNLYRSRRRKINNMDSNKFNGEKLKKFTIYTVVDLLVAAATGVIPLIMRNRYSAFAFLMTAIFYLPSLKNGSINAGFLYGGDSLGWYLPALEKTHSLLHSFNFTAIDFSSFNGSSDFFLSANFFAYHPLVIIYSLFIPAETTSIQESGNFLVLLLAVHSFLAVYFSTKLFTRFFSFEFGTAALIATIFTFSAYMIFTLGQPNYVFIATIIPWAAYGSLSYCETPNIRKLVYAILPIIFGFMGGYLPLGVAALALSVVLVATKLLVVDNTGNSYDELTRALFFALLPYVCASIIVGPYLYSTFQFLRETLSADTGSLFYSAHQLAEQPQSLLRLISSNLNYFVPGPFYEFSISWGFIAIIIATIFFSSAKTIGALTPQDWKIFKISAIVYFATILAIFGEFSVVSDLVYHLVPQVGKMHIYQRFLLLAHLLFAVMAALMLKAVVQVRPPVASRVVLALTAIAMLMAAYLMGRNPSFSQEIGLNNYLVFELLLAFLFACALIVPGKNFVYSSAIVLFCLPALDRMYDFSDGGNTFQKQQVRQKIALDSHERAQLVTYFKRFSDKVIIKYVDITPLWTKEGVETFPKVFPFFVLNEIQLSSYGGFTFYLSARADYMSKMPVAGPTVAVSPDWEYLKNTGADFVVARNSDVQHGALSGMFSKIKNEDLYKLPNDVVIFPIQTQTDKQISSDNAIFDNGYFKVFPTITISGSNNNLLNVAKGKITKQSSLLAGGEAMRAVDGNTEGDFTLGSVTHTGADINAWLDIDLGQSESIDSVRIWNRTDGSGDRLRDYWVFISEAPFLANDTASALRSRPATWGQANFTPNPKITIRPGDVRGRYLRVQLGGNQPIGESYLSLAEVEVFRSDKPQALDSASHSSNANELQVKKFTTNKANYLRLDLVSSAPATVQYLFWDNPRLTYYLNDQRISLVKRDGLNFINIPAGINTIEIQYRHWPLILFWWFYTIYALMFLWALMPTRFHVSFWQKVFHRGNDTSVSRA